MDQLSRKERLALFFQRQGESPPFQSFNEALERLSQILNLVEDEFSGVPFEPDAHETDGRMYPPQADSIRAVDEFPAVSRLRHKGHNTFINENGAIEIRLIAVPPESGDLLFQKLGSTGKGVWENEPAGTTGTTS
ncbi:MAG: hypothetical protein KIS61_00280 [Candidatus Eremiobacteraeota bacterium]|jgi:hypothetical protein|nr:hypothetical protein [Candidatus Eremiobacteraeota bacterium]